MSVVGAVRGQHVCHSGSDEAETGAFNHGTARQRTIEMVHGFLRFILFIFYDM
jgi:hypothetical protein